MTNSGNAPNNPRRLRSLFRRRIALQFRIAGQREEEIREAIYKAEVKQAEKAGEDPNKVKRISQQRVSSLITEARAALEDETAITAAEFKAIQKMDLGAALMVVRQGMGSKDSGERYAAIDRLNRLHERLAKLEGLDAPERKDITSDNKPLTFIIQREDGKDNTPVPQTA